MPRYPSADLLPTSPLRGPTTLALRAIAFALAVVALLFVSIAPVEGQEPPVQPPVRPPAPLPAAPTALSTASLSGQYLVKLDDSVDSATAVARLTIEAGVRVTRVLDEIGWVAVVDDAARVGLRASATSERVLDARPDVEAVQPVGAYFLDGVAPATPLEAGSPAPSTLLGNDPYFWQQWGLFRTNAVEAWDVTSGATSEGHRVRVAVVDTGVDLAHEDLAGRLVVEPGSDFIALDDDPSDQNGHGTHVAGAVVATRDNALGVSGMAPDAEVLVARACDGAGVCPWDAVAAAIVWATDHGAEVINLSISGPGPRPLATEPDAIRDAIEYALAADVVVVAASGNDAVAPIDGNEGLQYPAAYDGVIGIGALNPGGGRAAFSIVGSHVDLVAPGVSMLSTYPGRYAFLDGTSMATAVASGAAALVRAAHPQWTGVEVASALASSAEDLGAPGRDDAMGAGAIDVYRAITGLEPAGDFVEVEIAHARPRDLAVTLVYGEQIQVLFNNPFFRAGEPDIRMRYPVPDTGIEAAGVAAVPGDWSLGVADFNTGVTGTIETFAVTSAGVRHATTEPELPLEVPDGDSSGTATFTVVTLAVPTSNSALAGLEVAGLDLDPPFEPSTTAYALDVPYPTDSIEVTAALEDPDATLAIDGEPAESGVAATVPLDVGSQDIEVRVTAADGVNETVYTLTVDRAAPSTNAALATLEADGVTLAPTFDADTLDYAATVLEAVDALSVTVEASDPTATIEVAGAPAGASGTIEVPLALGDNDVEVVVTAQDGVTQRTYHLVIERLAPSTDWTLASLEVGDGVLTPAFELLKLGPYAVDVGNGVESIELTATASADGASISLDGTPIESGVAIEVSLAVGANDLAIEVTAVDGVTSRAYLLSITRAAAPPAPPAGGGGGGGGGAAPAPTPTPTPTPSPTPVAGPPPAPALAIAGFQPQGVSLWVISPGGTMSDLMAAVSGTGAEAASCTFATLADGTWFIYIAGALNPQVNAAWNARYEGGLPDRLPMWSRCAV